VLRLIGEISRPAHGAAGHGVRRQQPPDKRPPRYVITARTARKPWSTLHQRGSVTGDAFQCLQEIESKFNLTGSALPAIEPFD